MANNKHNSKNTFQNNSILIGHFEAMVPGISRYMVILSIQKELFKFYGYEKLVSFYKKRIKITKETFKSIVNMILTLNGELRYDATKKAEIIDDPIAFLKVDLKATIEAINWLQEITGDAATEYYAYKMLMDLYEIEIKIFNYLKKQLNLAEEMGRENYITFISEKKRSKKDKKNS